MSPVSAAEFPLLRAAQDAFPPACARSSLAASARSTNFELLTLIQTGKMKPMPILLFGGRTRVVDFGDCRGRDDFPKDLDLITWSRPPTRRGRISRVLRPEPLTPNFEGLPLPAAQSSPASRTAWCPSGLPRYRNRAPSRLPRGRIAGQPDAVFHVLAVTQQGGDGSRQRAARAMRIAAVDPRIASCGPVRHLEQVDHLRPLVLFVSVCPPLARRRSHGPWPVPVPLPGHRYRAACGLTAAPVPQTGVSIVAAGRGGRASRRSHRFPAGAHRMWRPLPGRG